MKTTILLASFLCFSMTALIAQNSFSGGEYLYTENKEETVIYYSLMVSDATAELTISGNGSKYAGTANCQVKQKGETVQFVFASATDEAGKSRKWDIASSGTVLFEFKGEPRDFYTNWKALKPVLSGTSLEDDQYFFEMAITEDPLDKFNEEMGLAEAEEELAEEEISMEPYETHYEGSIGGEPIIVVMTITIDASGQDQLHEGYYYFLKDGIDKKIKLDGGLDTSTGMIYWYERDEKGNLKATFNLAARTWETVGGRVSLLLLSESKE